VNVITDHTILRGVLLASAATSIGHAIWRHGRRRGLEDARRAAEVEAVAGDLLRDLGDPQ
jgi:hypothetical protein